MISSLDISSSIESSIDQNHQNLIALERNLFEAIARNSIAEINKILYQNPSLINASFLTGKKSLLAFATELGNHDIVKLLIEFDVDIPTYSINFESSHPLAIAVKNNNLKITKLLFEALEKSEIREQKFYKDQIRSQDYRDPLDDAISVQDGDDYQDLLINALLEEADFEITKLLANFLKNVKKIDLNSIRYHGNNLLHISSSYQIFKFFLEQGLDIDHLNNEYLTPISLSISRGLIDIVKNLLAEKFFEINQILGFHDQCCAIHYAVLNKNIAMIEFLIENGADISLVDSEGRNIIAIAVCEGEIKVLKELILIIENKDPDNLLKYLNSLDENNLSPIHLAIQNKDIENDNFQIIKLLLSYKVDLEFPNDPDTNLLHFIRLEDHDILKLLLENKCDVHLKNSLGKNFIEVVLMKRNYAVMKILYDFKIDLLQALDNITLNSRFSDIESHNLINYLEFSYSSEILEKISLAYQKFKDVDIKFDPKDKVSFPTFTLFEIIIFVDANFRGGVIKNAEMVKGVVDFINQNPHSLEIFDEISQDFLAPCSFKPSLGFFRIATLVESTKKSSIIDKLAVLQRLQIFEIINFQIAKFCKDDQRDPKLFPKTTILAFEILKIINQKFSLGTLKDVEILSQEQRDQISLSSSQKSKVNQELWLGIPSYNTNQEIRIFLDRFLKDKLFMDEIYSQSSLILESPIDNNFVKKLFDDEFKTEIDYVKFLALMNSSQDLRDRHQKEIKELQEKINDNPSVSSEVDIDGIQEIHQQIIEKKSNFNIEIVKIAKEFFLEKVGLSSQSLSQSSSFSLSRAPSQSPYRSLVQTRDSSQAELSRLGSSAKMSISSLVN